MSILNKAFQSAGQTDNEMAGVLLFSYLNTVSSRTSSLIHFSFSSIRPPSLQGHFVNQYLFASASGKSSQTHRTALDARQCANNQHSSPRILKPTCTGT